MLFLTFFLTQVQPLPPRPGAAIGAHIDAGRYLSALAEAELREDQPMLVHQERAELVDALGHA
jgi:hypothetical protein